MPDAAAPAAPRADLIVTNALIVTADAGFSVIPDGALAVRDGRIAAIGPAAEIGRDAAEVIDAGGAILMPGIVNTHCHAGDSLFRGLVEDLPLEPWLQTVWKAEKAILTRETTRLGATLGLAELLLSGVTTAMDMFWFPEETARAARDLGMRVATGGIFIDFPGVDFVTMDDRIAAAKDFFAEFEGADDILPTIMPHGTYTVGPDNLAAAKALAEDHGALFCTHAAETVAEQADIANRYGRSVIRHLDHLGCLDERTVLAHCVWLDDEEIAILARTGATVSHNPVSNLKLASGIARVPDMLDAGVRVTVGTDGAISGNDLDMWMALRLAATLHRGATRRADAVSTQAALAMVTREGAAALGALDRIGSLEVGKFADMILIDTGPVHAAPLFDPMTHIVFSTAKSDVRDVFVSGRRVVRDGVLTAIDIGGTLARVRALAPAIAASIA
ncbi:amidohydrolase [Amaricoccus solimangrovi]|uniref:Amidohydrolase n=1 Tax=Amaricoccus solimangrovi TaxID=2589815 RepID=A0A501WWX4_9RHOB|nr:amidohydrolase [Amaricoccus solimangrovi]TPE52755.1 amidohydrolase [Amaricoccus solimangrovi]